MPKYENISTDKIEVNSLFTNAVETFLPSETKTINFYIDHNETRLVLQTGDEIEPVLYSSTENTSATPIEILVNKPVFSPYYRIKVIPGTEDLNIVFNKSANNAIEVKTTELFERIMIWEYAPIIYISTASASTAKVIIEEVFGIPGV